MTQVIAKVAGFYEAFRNPGDVFEVDGSIPPWCESVSSSIPPTLPERSTPADPRVTAVPGAPLPIINGVGAPLEDLHPQYQVPELDAGKTSDEEPVYTIKHKGGGDFVVLDGEGNQVGDVFESTGTTGESKASAQAEADKLNSKDAGGTTDASGDDADNLPDA